MKPLYLLIFLLLFPLSTQAQITIDGSLGPQLNLQGPNYQIGPDLGQQRGGNLFHSFQDFNLQSWESATFSGPNHIQNVISRVTGGNPSQIDGLFRSTIQGADVYFLNPYGIMFGPNAKLDVQGSFHASTADYLRLGDGGRFDVRNPSDSILTVAPIESFGFLEVPAPISVQGHGKVTPDWENKSTGLSVPKGKTLSLIGGPIEIKNGTFITTVADTEFDESVAITRLDSLNAPGGQINLVAIASSGEVNLGRAFLDVSSFAELADVSITDQSLLQVSGEGSGNIFIRGAQVILEDSFIRAKSSGNQKNGIIDIKANSLSFKEGARIRVTNSGKQTGAKIQLQANESITFSGKNIEGLSSGIFQWTDSKEEGAGDAGTLSITAKNIELEDGADFLTWTSGQGNAASLTIQAQEKFSMTGIDSFDEEGSRIYSSPFSSSNGGHGNSIVIEAKEILIADGAYISGTTFGPGNGADIHIHAKESITIIGVNDAGYASGIFANSKPLRESGAKEAGDITIEANQLILGKGAMISSSTIAAEERQSGKGGNITIQVTGKIDLSGVNIYGENEEGLGSGIFVYSRSVGGNAGDAGNISLQANSLHITEGANISSSTNSSAQGGDVTIIVNEQLSISGNSSHIKLSKVPAEENSQSRFQEQFPQLRISTSGIYANSSSQADNAGTAGNLTIQAHQIDLNRGTINTSTKNSGGGKINVTTSHLLYLQNSQITTTVHAGSGDSGNITVENPTFVVLNQGQIKAQADAGQGGNIRIVAEHFVKSYESLISASSRLGLDGNVQIDSPAVDLDAMLVVLQGTQLDAKVKTCNVIEELDNPTYIFRVKKRDRSYPLMK